ncbi:MAG: M55 family metallopeptidase [Planctomycetes bacterium]|nr:M55 family metallopeptidase [Planctomycetota bacterium]
MKIFISADMEGVTGIVHGDQLMPSGKTYERGRKLMTADINAAITGALREAPEAEFVVCDGHAVMRNIILEELHEAAQLVIGPAHPNNKPLCQSQGCDESFDLAFFTGYHSRAGTPNGLLSHTWVGSTISNFRINGDLVGETAINAAVVGHWDIPVGLVSGANELEPEAQATIPEGFVFAGTKKTYGFSAALCLPPAKTQKLLNEGAAEAVRRFKEGKLKPYKPTQPVTFEVEVHRREMADKSAQVPGVERKNERTITVTADSTIAAAETMWRGVCRAQDSEPDWLK